MTPQSHPVPWKQVLALTRHIRDGSLAPMGRLYADIASRLVPVPEIVGEDRLPAQSRFLLVANHYQRPGLWIAYPAALIADVISRHYRIPDLPVRWLVTANWPRWRLGPWRFPSPGDWLLPRVAAATGCFSIPFAGSDPMHTARSLRRLLREVATSPCPIGLFPEGVAGQAGRPAPPLPGVDRLIRRLAGTGLPAVPVHIDEIDGRLSVSFLETVPAVDVFSWFTRNPARVLTSSYVERHSTGGAQESRQELHSHVR